MVNIRTKKKQLIKNNRTKKRNSKYLYNNDEQDGGFFLDFLYKSKIKRIVEHFIEVTNKDIKEEILNKFFKNSINKNYVNIKMFDKYLTIFLVNMLIIFYKKLKKHKRLFKYKESKKTGKKSTDFNYKYIFTIKKKNNLKNKYILAVLKNFISLLFNKSQSLNVVNVINDNIRYKYKYYSSSNEITKLINYFNDNTISIDTVNNYLKDVIDIDKNNNYNLFTINDSDNTKKKPIINYTNIMNISHDVKNSENDINNINNNYINKVYLIIFKNYSKDNKRDKFSYISDVSEDDFYILENNFIKIRTGIDKYFNKIRKDSKIKKKKRKHNYMIEDINRIFFTNHNAKNYGEFLYYLYCSTVFNYY